MSAHTKTVAGNPITHSPCQNHHRAISGLTIASKSIPRSGHHLLKAILKAGFGKQLVHCEWYFEPGCCRQVPCKLHSAYCRHDQRIQLIKSHDFLFEDAIPNAQDNVVTLIGYRHPLWVLTSNFIYSLRQAESRRLGISGKMEYLHEPAVTDMLTENCHEHLPESQGAALRLWLGEQSAYQIKFFRKWLSGDSGKLAFDETTGFLNCPYEQIDGQENALLLLEWLAGRSGVAVGDPDLHFIKPSRGPWHCSNKRVASFFNAQREEFVEAASFIVREAGLAYEQEPEALVVDLPQTGVMSDGAGVVSNVNVPKTPMNAAKSVTKLLAEENLALKRECIALRAMAREEKAGVNSLRRKFAVRFVNKVSSLLRTKR